VTATPPLGGGYVRRHAVAAAVAGPRTCRRTAHPHAIHPCRNDAAPGRSGPRARGRARPAVLAHGARASMLPHPRLRRPGAGFSERGQQLFRLLPSNRNPLLILSDDTKEAELIETPGLSGAGQQIRVSIGVSVVAHRAQVERACGVRPGRIWGAHADLQGFCAEYRLVEPRLCVTRLRGNAHDCARHARRGRRCAPLVGCPTRLFKKPPCRARSHAP
jgi:hypothetical protein